MNIVEYENKTKLNFINKLTIFFLIIVIFEGSIRKWVTNSYNLEIILFRDSLVIVGILYGFINSNFKLNGKAEKILVLWTSFVLFWILLQIVFKELNLFVGLIGVRNWVLYFWFAILIFRSFNKWQLDYLIKILIILSFPIIILGCVQYFLPIDNILNKSEVEGDFIFQFVDGVVRPSSFFTFTYGYTQYLFLSIPILFFYFITLSHESKKVLSSLIFFLIIASTFFSGSRQVIIFTLILFFLIYFKKKEYKIIDYKIFFINFLILFTIFIFFNDIIFDNFERIQTRFSQASTNEKIFNRIIFNIIGDPEYWKLFSLIGEGIGSSSNMARSFININEYEYFKYGHNEIDRILIEGGLLGIVFISIKYLFILHFFKKSFWMKLNNSNLMIFLLFYFIFIQCFFSSITGQISSQAITVLGMGIFLSYFYKEDEKKKN